MQHIWLPVSDICVLGVQLHKTFIPDQYGVYYLTNLTLKAMVTKRNRFTMLLLLTLWVADMCQCFIVGVLHRNLITEELNSTSTVTVRSIFSVSCFEDCALHCLQTKHCTIFGHTAGLCKLMKPQHEDCKIFNEGVTGGWRVYIWLLL